MAVNLARVAARAGSKVLLIDGDLRKPSISSVLEIDNGASLVDLLREEGDLDASVTQDPSSGLYTIAGARRASGDEAIGLLTSERLARLIQSARNVFDLVVIDTSPLLAVADSRLLLELADAAILVVASERTSRDALMTALSESPELESKLAGVVLNGTDDIERYYRYGSASPVAAEPTPGTRHHAAEQP